MERWCIAFSRTTTKGPPELDWWPSPLLTLDRPQAAIPLSANFGHSAVQPCDKPPTAECLHPNRNIIGPP
jgi:hypothetical protein